MSRYTIPSSEDALQRSMVDWLNACVPQPPEGPWWTAVNPAPNKSKATAGRSKAMGMKAGTPDLVFVWKGRFVAIEVKLPGKSLSKVQKEVHELIGLAGGVRHTVHSLVELEMFLQVIGVPMRGRAAA